MSRHAAMAMVLALVCAAAPFGRGINSIQLFNDGTRWWIVSVLWDRERPANPLPAKYLPRAGRE